MTLKPRDFFMEFSSCQMSCARCPLPMMMVGKEIFRFLILVLVMEVMMKWAVEINPH